MIRAIYLIVFLVIVASASHAQYWERTGGPGGDFMYDLSLAPNGNLFIVSQTVHRSADNGVNWLQVAPSMSTFLSEVPKIAWSSSGIGFMIKNKSVWRSTDNGDSWTKVLQALTGSTPGLAYSPNGFVIATSYDSVYISSDEGVSWITTKPHPQGSIYGAPSVDKDGVIYLQGDEGYLYRSTNNGASWSKILNGLPISNSFKRVYSINQGLAIVTVDNYIYVSTDSGRVWNAVHNAPTTVISVAALNADTVFSMTYDCKIEWSTNSGQVWRPYSSALWGMSLYGGVELMSNGTDLFVLLHDVLYKHTPATTKWEVVSVPTGFVTSLCAGPSGSIYASTSIPSTNDESSTLWNLTGSKWTEERELKQVSINGLAVDSNEILFAVINGHIKKSLSKGRYWTDGIRVTGQEFQLAVTDDMVFLSSNVDGVLRSSDMGTTWDQLNSGIADPHLASIGASDNYVFTGGMQKYYRSTDNGWNWTEPVFPFIFGSGVVRAIDCAGPNVILGVDLTGTYFSSDYGLTWENHSAGLALDTIFRVLATPSGAVFAGTSSGAYEYDPVAKTWKNVNDGMLTGSVTSLALGKDGRIYAGTNGDGVYRSTKTYGSWIRSVKRDVYSPDDISIYPNPASTEVQLHFNADSPERYRIVICDLLGETVQVTQDAATIDVSTLRNGQYFLRIVSHDGICTLPLTIFR